MNFLPKKYRVLFLVCLFLGTHYCAAQSVETDDEVLLALLKESTSAHISRQPWRGVQERAKDTVVQIFAQCIDVDLLQPYKSPDQYQSRGSGFFINERGDFITNAHVVENAAAVWIQIPSLGKHPIDAEIVGICPERDLALLRLSEKGFASLVDILGTIPFLPLGNSDTVRRSDEVLALGYPLGQESLKSTTGVISGQEGHYLQISAPINPGNSGGPLLNIHGEVIGINSAAIVEAQNVGYSIPISDLHVILKDLYIHPIVRKPYLGIVAINGTDELTDFCGNPQPGGAYIIDVLPDSPLQKADIRVNDMIYSINGCELDMYCQIRAPWTEEKISVIDYISRLALGEMVNLVVYRNGERLDKTIMFDFETKLAPIRQLYPLHEPIDYEIFGGMVVMELATNHIKILADKVPGLAQYYERKNQVEPLVIITHIFANSLLHRSRTLTPGSTIHEINGHAVRTLQDFRDAIATSDDYFTIKASNNMNYASDMLFVVLSFEKLITENKELSRIYRYPISPAVADLSSKK